MGGGASRKTPSMDDCWKALLAKREELAKDSQALWLVAFDWIAAASADSCGVV
jgi:hypothetical protein